VLFAGVGDQSRPVYEKMSRMYPRICVVYFDKFSFLVGSFASDTSGCVSILVSHIHLNSFVLICPLTIAHYESD
jgi:hypothetical protein